ncbi:MAG: CBS domain-containing protein [Lentimonas sp.]|jgi:CBS domain-containing protein
MSIHPNDYSVSDVMITPSEFPVVTSKALYKEALESMSKFKIGIACVVDQDDKLLGIITDGDVRRQLLTNQKPFSALFVDDAIVHASAGPTTISVDAKLTDAIDLMGDKQVWDLPVVDADNTLVGLVHLHPAIKKVLEN